MLWLLGIIYLLLMILVELIYVQMIGNAKRSLELLPYRLYMGYQKKVDFIQLGVFSVLVFVVGALKTLVVNSFWVNGLHVEIDKKPMYLDIGVKDVVFGDESNLTKMWSFTQSIGLLFLAFLSFFFWYKGRMSDMYSNVTFKALLKEKKRSTIQFFGTLNKVESTTWDKYVKAAKFKKTRDKVLHRKNLERIVAQIYSDDSNFTAMAS